MIVKEVKNIVCDLDGCSNLASKQILFNSESKVGLNLCKKCLMNLYDLMASRAHGKGGEKIEKR